MRFGGLRPVGRGGAWAGRARRPCCFASNPERAGETHRSPFPARRTMCGTGRYSMPRGQQAFLSSDSLIFSAQKRSLMTVALSFSAVNVYWTGRGHARRGAFHARGGGIRVPAGGLPRPSGGGGRHAGPVQVRAGHLRRSAPAFEQPVHRVLDAHALLGGAEPQAIGGEHQLGEGIVYEGKRRQFALVCLGACKRFGHLDVEALVVLVGHEVYLAFKQCAHGHVVATAHELVEYHALELSAQALWGIVAS